MKPNTLSTMRRRLAGVQEGADYLGISVWSLRKRCYEGKCSSVKMGERLMVEWAELDRMIEESTRPRTA